MFFNGFLNDRGHCAAGGPHVAQGFEFALPHDEPETPNAESAWRFCRKCNAMFFDGFPTKGTCPAGGAHEPAGFMFVLPHDIPANPNAQPAWRFCHKCNAMFFDGFPNKGKCPSGGGHEPGRFTYVLPFLPEDSIVLDAQAGSDLPMQGSAHAVLKINGDWIFACHVHDSGFDNIDYGLAAVVVSQSGKAYSFRHDGSVEGTIAGLPFGKPRRDDNFETRGNNPAINLDWEELKAGAHFLPLVLSGKDSTQEGLDKALDVFAKGIGLVLPTLTLIALLP
jgi:hypothetical protein